MNDDLRLEVTDGASGFQEYMKEDWQGRVVTKCCVPLLPREQQVISVMG